MHHQLKHEIIIISVQCHIWHL